jgi:tRNA pseudouridine38-40 synthase
MAPYQVTIAYDGTEFNGFQRQIRTRTVQGEFEAALKKLGWKERSILSAGRTDRGVHAEGQVVSFHLDWQHTEIDLQNALNDILPADISAIRILTVEDQFHPRFDALMRKYRYQIYFAENNDPLKERFHWRVWPKPDINLIETGSSLFLGSHDFRGYGKPPESTSPTIRTIQSLEWEHLSDGSGTNFRISAKAFLYHMVRRIVYVLIRVGQERISISELKESIENQSELPAGIAPAKGLVLEEIIYK